MLIKALNFRGKVPNSQRRIAAHLQGAQNPTRKANLAKELQSPTHGNLLLNAKFIVAFYKNITTLGYSYFKRIMLNFKN
jgi:hypothetical protein